jgi:3-oxoacyl-[acyl-carrier-protein] synthase-1
MNPGVVVTGMTANTSLGDTETACAAARACLARTHPLDQTIFDAVEGPIPIVGHPVAAVSGFQADARLLALALPALVELREANGLDARESIDVCLAVPDLYARARTAGSSEPPLEKSIVRLGTMAGLGAQGSFTTSLFNHFTKAVEEAQLRLTRGLARLCVVGAVDTLCDDLAIAALATQRRLGTPDHPVGVHPGEAAAFVILERAGTSERASTARLPVVRAASTRRNVRADERAATGEALAAAIAQLVEQSGPLPIRDTWFLLDRNGEEACARNWACGCVRLMTAMPGLLPAPEWDPATAFGDTGIAGCALAFQMAIRAMARGYAPGRCAVVVGCAHETEQAAIRLDRGT